MDRQSMVGCDCVEASLLGDCTGFLGLPQQITTNLMAQNNKNLFSTSAADWSLKSICQQGCAPSKGSWGERIRLCLFSFCHLQASPVCGHITLTFASVFTEPSLCFFVPSSVSYKDTHLCI